MQLKEEDLALLGEEIRNALVMDLFEVADDVKCHQLVINCREKLSKIEKLYGEIKGINPRAKDFSIDDMLIWLDNNKLNVMFTDLSNAQQVVQQAESELEDYCTQRPIFLSFLNKLGQRKLPLGHKSLFLYAKLALIPLHIWRPIEGTQEVQLIGHCAGDQEPVHLLHSNTNEFCGLRVVRKLSYSDAISVQSVEVDTDAARFSMQQTVQRDKGKDKVRENGKTVAALKVTEPKSVRGKTSNSFELLAIKAAKTGDVKCLEILLNLERKLQLEMHELRKKMHVLTITLRKLNREIRLRFIQIEAINSYYNKITTSLPELNQTLANQLGTAKKHFFREYQKLLNQEDYTKEQGQLFLQKMSQELDKELKSYTIATIVNDQDVEKRHQDLEEHYSGLVRKKQALLKLNEQYIDERDLIHMKLFYRKQKLAGEYLKQHPDIVPKGFTTFEFMQVLLSADLSPCLSEAGTGDSLLHFAIRENWPDLIALLLDYGADMNAQNHAGISIAETAAYHGNIAAANQLLQHGLRLASIVDKTDAEGRILLHYAVQNPNYYPLAMHLLQNGANFFQADKQGRTSWQYAIKGIQKENKLQRQFIETMIFIVRDKGLEIRTAYAHAIPATDFRSDIFERLIKQLTVLEQQETLWWVKKWLRGISQQNLEAQRQVVVELLVGAGQSHNMNDDTIIYDEIKRIIDNSDFLKIEELNAQLLEYCNRAEINPHYSPKVYERVVRECQQQIEESKCKIEAKDRQLKEKGQEVEESKRKVGEKEQEVREEKRKREESEHKVEEKEDEIALLRAENERLKRQQVDLARPQRESVLPPLARSQQLSSLTTQSVRLFVPPVESSSSKCNKNEAEAEASYEEEKIAESKQLN